MPLLPDGERARSRVGQLVFAGAALWLGWQGFVNVHRYSALAQNLGSLAGELNLGGEQVFRARLAAVLALNDVPLDPAEVRVSLDAARDVWVVTAPCRWTLDFGFAAYATHTTLRASIPRQIFHE